MKLRPYKKIDAKFLAELFYSTIHSVNTKDYSPEEVNAWAPPLATWDMEKWQNSFNDKFVFVVEEGKLAGFGELEKNGHIDRFYIHKDFIGLGVGTLIYDQIEAKANELKLTKLFVEASITAKPFFEKMGFSLVKEQRVFRNEVYLTNFVMEKSL